jgi:hypothetical protein
MDLLAILSHKRGWIDELFHQNRAKTLSYHQAVPLMVFQPDFLKNGTKPAH